MVSSAPSTAGPREYGATRAVWDCSASTRWPSRLGSTCWSLVSARSALSSIPLTAPPLAVRNETATATASSSSRSRGGMAAPAVSR